EVLIAWADGNAPLGASDDRPRPAPDSNTASLGSALSITIPAGHPVRAAVERFDLAETDATRWIRAWSVTPGDARVLERAVILSARGEAIGSWVPGDDIVRLPQGVAQEWPAKTKLAVELHYRKTEIVTTAAGVLTLFVGGTPRLSLAHHVLPCATSRL